MAYLFSTKEYKGLWIHLYTPKHGCRYDRILKDSIVFITCLATQVK